MLGAREHAQPAKILGDHRGPWCNMRASPLPVKFPRAIVRALALALACVAPAVAMNAVAGEYPIKPITIVVPYAPGGGGDVFTRAIAAQAQDIFGARIFVENRTGGGGTIGVGSVARAEGDGYTLAFVSTSPVVVSPNFLSVPYDPAVDLTYLSRFVLSHNPVLVRADSPFDSFKKLLGFARVNPGRLRWATAGINGAPHLATDAAFKQEGIKAAFVPMQGSAEVMAGLLGGTLDMGVISDYAAPLAAGEIRVLAEIGPEPIPELPAVPTFRQMNYPLAPTIFYGLAGPAGLSQEVIGKWDAAMQTITSSDRFRDVAERLSAQPAYLDHQAFHELVLKDIESMRGAFNSDDPGISPQFMPRLAIAGIVLALAFGSLMLLMGREPRGLVSGEAARAGLHPLRAAGAVVICLSFAYAGFSLAGFYLGGVAMAIILTLLLGERRVLGVLLFPVLILIAIYAIFELGLSIRLPKSDLIPGLPL